MTNGVSDLSGSAMLGLALLENAQQNREDGKTQRDAGLELSIAAKKVGTIYEGIEQSTKKAERITSYISAGMAVVSVGMSAYGVGSAAQAEANIKKLPTELPEGAEPWPSDPDARLEELGPPRTQAEARRLQAYQARHPNRFEKPVDKLRDGLKAVFSEALSVTSNQMGERAEGAAHMKDGAKKVAEAREEASDAIAAQTEEDNEVLTEMAKIGAVFVKPA